MKSQVLGAFAGTDRLGSGESLQRFEESDQIHFFLRGEV